MRSIRDASAALLLLIGWPAAVARGFQGADLEPPAIEVSRPARGEYLAAPVAGVEGTATDAGSGVAALEVNGQPVAVGADGRFGAQVALEFGVNLVTVKATDFAGNTASSTLGLMYAPTYLPTDQDVPLAAAARLNESGLNALAPVMAQALTQSGALQHSLSRGLLFRGAVEDAFGKCLASARVAATPVTFDPIQLQLDPVPGGIDALVHVPSFTLRANARSYCGIPYSVSGEVSARATAAVHVTVAVGGGGFRVSPGQSAVVLNGFRFDIQGIPSIIENLVRAGVEGEVRRRLEDELPPLMTRAIRRSLERLSEPVSYEVGETTVTVVFTPTGASFDDLGFTVAFDGNVTAARDPATPTAPGSVFRASPSGGIPQYASAPGFYVSLNENAINRALFTTWQAGFWSLTIDQAFIDRLGVQLPFSLDSRLIAAFFPQLAGTLPSGGPFPLAVQLDPRMQPVVEITGPANPITLALGELHLAVVVDLGRGFTPVIQAAAHVEAVVNPAVEDTAVILALAPTLHVEADVLGQPLGPVTGPGVERFLQVLLPPAIQHATISIAPIPLPMLQGLTLVNLRVYPDGTAREFLTVDGDVR